MSHNFEPIEDMIIAELKAKLEDFSVKVDNDIQVNSNDRENLILSLKQQLEENKKKQTQICDFLENGVYTVEMFVSRNNKIKEEIDRIEKAIKKAEQEIPRIQEAKDYIVTFHQTLDMLKDESISAKVKNEYLKKIIKVIYYVKTKDEISIEIHLNM
jgi:predicted nuclease with TOPRIM domain